MDFRGVDDDVIFKIVPWLIVSWAFCLSIGFVVGKYTERQQSIHNLIKEHNESQSSPR